MPPPEPRSRTTSPGFNCASAVGFPHPSEASMASSGICPACEGSYRLEVIGSQPEPLAAVAPQQLLPPLFTRKRCLAIFFFDDFLMSVVLMVRLLFAKLNDVLGFDRLVAGAALGVKELQQFLQRFGVGRVAQERALAAHIHQVFVFQLVQVMRKRGVRNVELFLDFAHDQPVGMRG